MTLPSATPAPDRTPGPGTAPDLEVIVRQHRPAPQGSKRHVGRGRLVEESKRVGPWRDAVKAAAMIAMNRRSRARRGEGALDGPLLVRVVFTVRKPASALKRRVMWPITRDSGDIDKLLRSSFDALTDAGAIADDSRIVDITARKVHPNQDPDALDQPGAVIRIWRLAETAGRK